MKLSYLRAFWRAALAAGSICWMALPLLCQHGHIYVGALSQSQGAPLFFQNADVWDTNSYGGYAGAPACIYFDDNLPDLYPGVYQSATTFVALPATIFTGGPSPFAAAIGSYIELRFVSLEGPAEGILSVWNEADDPDHPTTLLTLPVGTTNGVAAINLSEGDPSDSSADPYGHIHGRRFTLNKPGLYTLGLQLIDTSSNGADSGPIQSPSGVTYFYLQAGLSLSDFSVTNHIATARFGLPGLADYAVEATSVLPGTNWVTITNITGTAHSELRWITDAEATPPTRFYRVRKISN